MKQSRPAAAAAAATATTTTTTTAATLGRFSNGRRPAGANGSWYANEARRKDANGADARDSRNGCPARRDATTNVYAPHRRRRSYANEVDGMQMVRQTPVD